MSTYSWRKSSYSGDKLDCVEVAPAGQIVLVRDTKQVGAGPVISVDRTEWAVFLDDLRAS